jgi:hypothetical protein
LYYIIEERRKKAHFLCKKWPPVVISPEYDFEIASVYMYYKRMYMDWFRCASVSNIKQYRSNIRVYAETSKQLPLLGHNKTNKLSRFRYICKIRRSKHAELWNFVRGEKCLNNLIWGYNLIPSRSHRVHRGQSTIIIIVKLTSFARDRFKPIIYMHWIILVLSNVQSWKFKI